MTRFVVLHCSHTRQSKVWILLTEALTTVLLTLHNGQTVHVHHGDNEENMQEVPVSLYMPPLWNAVLFLDTSPCSGSWYGICLFPAGRQTEKLKTSASILHWIWVQIQNSFCFKCSWFHFKQYLFGRKWITFAHLFSSNLSVSHLQISHSGEEKTFTHADQTNNCWTFIYFLSSLSPTYL